MSNLDFFQSYVLPKMIASKAFGGVVDIIEIKLNHSNPLGFQLMSDILFVDVNLKVSGVERTFPLVCKSLCDDPELRKNLQLDIQFFNETLIYKEIAPLLPGVDNLLPKFYIGQSGHELASENYLVVENLMSSGYKLTSGLCIDFEHCCLAFKKLGEFHGASLCVKENHPQFFKEKVQLLGEQRWIEIRKEELNYAYREYAKRGILPLLEKGESSEILKTFIKKLDDIFSVMMDIFKANDMSVLCHGDFNLNNMIFKYEEARPTDVKFFDFATARFTSPVVDISFFIFLNMTSEVRRKHLRHDFLTIYLEGVERVAGSLAPTMEQLWREFQEKAIYGYLVVAMFLPIVMDRTVRTVATDISVEERVRRNLARGGDSATDMLVEAVRDLVFWECLN